MSLPLGGLVSVVDLSVGQHIGLVKVILRHLGSVPGQLQLILDLPPGSSIGIFEAGYFRASVSQYQDRYAGLPQPLQVPQHLPVLLSLAPVLVGDVFPSLAAISLSSLSWK